MGSRADRAAQRTESQLARDWRRAEKGQSTVGLLSTLTGPRQWEAPSFDMPALTNPADLKPLGTDRMGRKWFSHKKYGEMVETAELEASWQPIPNSVIVEVGRDLFRTFAPPVAPGTYDRLMNAAIRVPRPPAAHRPVDAIGLLFLGRARPERVAASMKTIDIRPAEGPVRGAAQILDRLKRAGATVRLATDKLALVVTTSGGHLGPGVLELVDRTAPLLVAHLNGSPLACTVSKHKTPALATTYALGGAPWCGECDGEK
jgi:hypothetical protein